MLSYFSLLSGKTEKLLKNKTKGNISSYPYRMDDNSVEKQLSVHLKWKLYIEVNLQVIKPRFSARLAQKYTIFEFKAQGHFQAVFSVHLYCSKDVKCFFLHSIDLPYKGTNCNSSLLQPKELHSPDSFKRPTISRQGRGNESKEPQLHPKDNTAETCAAHQRIQSCTFWFMLTWRLLFLVWYPVGYHLQSRGSFRLHWALH